MFTVTQHTIAQWFGMSRYDKRNITLKIEANLAKLARHIDSGMTFSTLSNKYLDLTFGGHNSPIYDECQTQSA